MTVMRAEALAVGDTVEVTVSGRTYPMTISMVYTDPSIGAANARTAIAHIRPGGYSVALRNDNLAAYGVRSVA